MHKIKTAMLALIAMGLITSCGAKTNKSSVILSDGIDASAGGDTAYIVTTQNATYYLEKSGGGLSSMLDKDGVDWLGFHKEGTDPSTSTIEIEVADHVRIVFTSENKKWEGQYDFYPERLDFTMRKVSPAFKYWVQYEGVPGGEMDRTDFRYSSADSQRHLIDAEFIGDLPGPEWMAFGDPKSPRMIYMLQHKDDDYPNDYVSRPDMTVLGFGRRNKDKFLTTPQRFSIGFVESTDYAEVKESINALAQ